MIEGFWSILKNGIKGNYRSVSKKNLPFYIAEYSYKNNRRGAKDFGFDDTITNAVSEDKCLVNYKPKGDVKKLCIRIKGRRKMCENVNYMEVIDFDNPYFLTSLCGKAQSLHSESDDKFRDIDLVNIANAARNLLNRNAGLLLYFNQESFANESQTSQTTSKPEGL
jgi:hypothetical protein